LAAEIRYIWKRQQDRADFRRNLAIFCGEFAFFS